METNKNLHDKIAQICLDHFKALPKSGKPNSTEWTVLSCIVLEQANSLSVVALGTGSKCIGQSKMSYNGDTLNDSHAEIMCRRSFLRYLYSEMIINSSLFIFDEQLNKFKLKSDVSFHFFTTHVPCGDCAIFSKQSLEDFGEIIQETSEEDELPTKKAKLVDDIFRTGAKCLKSDQNQDSKLPGKEFHVLGAVRTKPGRGDPTLSVSCSDKITKWCYLGIQGAVMSLILDKPIYLSSLTFADGTPFSTESLSRTFYDRIGKIDLFSPYKCKRIVIGKSNLYFNFAKHDEKQPCPSSISWCKITGKSLEVAVEGKKQGVTKTKINTEIGRLKICKLELFKSFISVCKLKDLHDSDDIVKMDYLSVKHMAEDYQKNWANLKKKFGVWTKKDKNLLKFFVEI